MALVIDRNSYIDIQSAGKADLSGAMLPPPEGVWGRPPGVMRTIPGYAADVEKSRAEARAPREVETIGHHVARHLR